MAEFHATQPEFIAKTAIATIWKVRTPHGPAALKLYHKPDMGADGHGFTLMTSLNGHGAAKVHKITQNAALTEWLDGPHLGDPTRIRHLAQSWGHAFTVNPRRLLHWAIAKCALSIAWRSGGTVRDDTEFALFQMLLETKVQNYDWKLQIFFANSILTD